VSRPAPAPRIDEAASAAETVRLLEEFGEPAAPALVAALLAHLRLLYDWNRRFALTAIRDPREGLRRHLLEALEALPLAGAATSGRLVDLGSGNGYPALPLLTCRPALDGTLFEARDAKAAFLRAALRESGLADRVRVERVRIAGPEALPAADVLTMRGFPEPERWIRAALERGAARQVLAWVSAEDAARIAALIPRAAVHPLRHHPTGALLEARA